MSFRTPLLKAALRPTIRQTTVTIGRHATTASTGRTAFQTFGRILAWTTAAGALFSAGAVTTMVTTMPAELLGLSFLSSKESLLRFQPTDVAAEEIEKQMAALPLVQSLRTDKTLEECRPHAQMPAKVLETNLTGKTLVGPGMLPTTPLTFRSGNGKEITTIVYLGHDLCGHPGIVHGGLLATILDEQSGFCCIPLMKQRMAVTAYLNLNYRRPAKADRFYVVKSKVERLDGRKAFVKARIEGLDGKVVADSDSLFVEPKWAQVSGPFYIVNAFLMAGAMAM